MLFDQGTPDTSVYMIAGYAIFFIIGAIYLISLVVRTRNLHRDLDTLKDLESDTEARTGEVGPSSLPRTPKSAAGKEQDGRPRPQES